MANFAIVQEQTEPYVMLTEHHDVQALQVELNEASRDAKVLRICVHETPFTKALVTLVQCDPGMQEEFEDLLARFYNLDRVMWRPT